MDERWMATWEDGVLKLIRSWSGICIIHLVLGEGDVHEMRVNPSMLEHNKDWGSEELLDFALSATRLVIDDILAEVPIPVNMMPPGVVGNCYLCPPDYTWTSGECRGDFEFSG